MAAADNVDEIEDLALFEDEPSAHEGLGGAKTRVLHDVGGDVTVGEAHGHRFEFGIRGAVAVGLAVMVDEGDLAALDIAAKRLVEQPHHEHRTPIFRPRYFVGCAAQPRSRHCHWPVVTLDARHGR